MENKIKHLEIIQNVINRMASNSFSLKGWSVTLLTGILALSGQHTDKMYFILAYLPILMFWGLDSYYLLQERLYRSLYNKVLQLPADKIDFSLDASKHECPSTETNFFKCAFSITELSFYLTFAIVSTGIICLMIY